MSQYCLGCFQEFEEELKICPHCGYEVGTKAQEAIHMVPGSLLRRRYTVGKVLGYGGFGVTYIAWDPLLEQRVAIKEYLPGEFSTRMPGQTQVTVFEGDKQEQFQSGLHKFVDEARHLAKFQNEPSIVKIYDSFEENGTAYIIMEYLEGETLSARLEREGTIPEDETVSMLMPVMESLKKVHKEGLLHRDIAPDNIFLTSEGKAKLIDFGASRYATTTHSRSLTVIIKPGFSPEEQYRSRGDQGPHTDVYSLAATMYKMISGVTPPDALERRARYENNNKDILIEPHRIKVDNGQGKKVKKISLQRENAILNALNVRIPDRTPDMEAFMKELEANPPAKRIYGKIKKLDFYRMPLWLKIVVPAVLVIVLGMAVLMLSGVISFARNQKDFYIPDGIVMVPDVEGMQAEEAIRTVEGSFLLAKTGGNIETKYIKAGTIVLQSPGTGSFLEKNGTVLLTVSSGGEIESLVEGKATVPYIIWDNLESAREKLSQAGLGEITTEEVYDENVAEGQVISQSLTSGTEVEEGTAIHLVVSKGPAPFTLQDYTNKSDGEVQGVLEKLGLTVKIEYENNNDVPEGTVLSQSIKPGEKIRRGDSITLTVSSGKETLKVESVVGKKEKEAEKLLKDQGFEVIVLESYDKEVEKGIVISQTPEGNSQQLYGSQVTIIISKGKQPIKVSFDSIGGNKVADITVYEGETYGELPTPRRSGFSFVGWYLSSDGEEAITADTLVSGSSDHTLVARWKEMAAVATTTPTTVAPTTANVPPTQAPATTAVPTLPVAAVTTAAPTAPPTTTAVPSTRAAATTAAPTTKAPTTKAPTTTRTTTKAPTTTAPPTTPAPTTTVPPTTPVPTTTEPPTIPAPALPNVGEIITMGYYGGEAIEWQVLAVEGGKALVISRYALDAKPYNTDKVDATWETCTLRSWLNNGFYYAAFSVSEQSKIVLSWVVNNDNPKFGTPGGNDTQDKIFVLSIDEAESYFHSDEERICYPTKYAIDNGCFNTNGVCRWWLRSPGYSSYIPKIVAADVSHYGTVANDGDGMWNKYKGVRPAFWYIP